MGKQDREFLKALAYTGPGLYRHNAKYDSKGDKQMSKGPPKRNKGKSLGTYSKPQKPIMYQSNVMWAGNDVDGGSVRPVKKKKGR